MLIYAESFLDVTLTEILKEKRSYFSILTERAMQTVDDFQVKQTVKEAFDSSKLIRNVGNANANSPKKKEKIVVLGR